MVIMKSIQLNIFSKFTSYSEYGGAKTNSKQSKGIEPLCGLLKGEFAEVLGCSITLMLGLCRIGTGLSYRKLYGGLYTTREYR